MATPAPVPRPPAHPRATLAALAWTTAMAGGLCEGIASGRATPFMFKPLASLGFVAAGLSAGAGRTRHGRLLVAGQILGAAGDVALLGQGPVAFKAGLALFAAGHGALVGACLQRGTNLRRFGLGLAAMALPAAAVAAWLGPQLPPDLVGPVTVYVALISAMVAAAGAATERGARAAVLGASAAGFYLSDLAVARDVFVQRQPLNSLIGLPLYYGAQLGLAVVLGTARR